MNMGAFACLYLMKIDGKYSEKIEDLSGLSKERPMLSFSFFANAKDEIIVKSSRLIKDKIVGSQSYIIDKEYIQSNPSKSIPELLAKLPGIKIKDLRGGGLGASQSIDIRGFGDTATSNKLKI